MNPTSILQSDKLNLTVAGISFQTWQVIAIVGLLFLLVIVMASVRRHFLEFTVHGAGMGVLLGFALALVIEGLVLVGGKTILTTTLGWKNAPKPIEKGIEAAHNQFIQVLGDKSQCEEGETGLIDNFQKLTPDEQHKVRLQICNP